MSLPRLAVILLFAWLLAWPGLPMRHCVMQGCDQQSCCARKKSSCGCESKSKPKLCTCEKPTGCELAFPNFSSPMALVLHVCLVLDFLQARLVAASAVPAHRLYEARGPTEWGLMAFQVALPPPA